jgi:hypothetical protein
MNEAELHAYKEHIKRRIWQRYNIRLTDDLYLVIVNKIISSDYIFINTKLNRTKARIEVSGIILDIVFDTETGIPITVLYP